MSEQENKGSDTPKPPDRSRRAVILATVGIVVIIGVAFVYAFIVAPFLHTRRIVAEYPSQRTLVSVFSDPLEEYEVRRQLVERLGGKYKAVRALRSYLRWPKWAAPNRASAVVLVCVCGEPGLSILIDVARDKSEDDAARIEALCFLDGLARESWLSTALENSIYGLGTRVPPDTEIERIIKAAAAALKKIRGEEPEE